LGLFVLLYIIAMAESRNTGQGQLRSETKLKLRIKTRNIRREDDERTCEAQ